MRAQVCVRTVCAVCAVCALRFYAGLSVVRIVRIGVRNGCATRFLCAARGAFGATKGGDPAFDVWDNRHEAKQSAQWGARMPFDFHGANVYFLIDRLERLAYKARRFPACLPTMPKQRGI